MCAMKYIFFVSLILLWKNSKGQPCDCRANFLYMKEKVEKNYVGFADKVPPSQSSRFAHFTDSLERLASGSDNRKCLGLLRAWLTYFKDLHISMTIKDDASNRNAIREIFSASEKVSLSEQAFRSYLDSNKSSLDPLEGIWEDENHVYRMGFIRDRSGKPDQFIGFILKADSVYWMPGQVKARIRRTGGNYQAVYYLNRDHSVFEPPIIIQQNRLSAGAFGLWFRKLPAGGDSDTITQTRTPHTAFFKVLDDRSCLLTIPGSGVDYIRAVDSIIRINQSVIQQRENLIIDLRNNSGGSVLTFEKLLPFIYTGPVINYGASVLATDDNIKYYYSQYDLPNISDSMKNVFRRDESELRKHEGTIYRLWPDDTLRLDKVLPYPKTVSVIINEYCASSTELFLLQAKQSSKVVIFGKHSAGAVDYSDAVTMKMPCELFSLRYSTSRTNRLPAEPLDNIGIRPDITIPDNIVNWVEFVQLKYNAH